MDDDKTTPILQTDIASAVDELSDEHKISIFWNIILKFLSIRKIDDAVNNIDMRIYINRLNDADKCVFNTQFKVVYSNMLNTLFKGEKSISVKDKKHICNIIFMGEPIYNAAMEDKRVFDIKKTTAHMDYSARLIPMISKIKLN